MLGSGVHLVEYAAGHWSHLVPVHLELVRRCVRFKIVLARRAATTNGRSLARMDQKDGDREVPSPARGRRGATGGSATDRLEAADEIIAAADQRDVEADSRDVAAVRRDQAADIAAFVHPEDGDSYGSDNLARRHAALDRMLAKDDRTSASDDRSMLTEDPVETPES